MLLYGTSLGGALSKTAMNQVQMGCDFEFMKERVSVKR